MRVSLLSLFPIAVLSACAASSNPEPDDTHLAEIDAYIRSLPHLPVATAEVIEGATTAAQRTGDYSCTTENLKETRQYDRIVGYAANSDSLWPGAIVSADSVVSGLFTQIVMPR